MSGAVEKIRVGKGASIDDQLIALANLDLSAEEISSRLQGVLSPARVMIRTKEILSGGNWLTDLEKERALIRILQTNLAELRSNYLDLDNAKVQLQYVKAILEQIDKRKKVLDETYNLIEVNQGRLMGRVYDMALSYIRGAFRQEVDAAKWDEVKQAALLHAREELAKYEVEA